MPRRSLGSFFGHQPLESLVLVGGVVFLRAISCYTYLHILGFQDSLFPLRQIYTGSASQMIFRSHWSKNDQRGGTLLSPLYCLGFLVAL